MNSVFDGREKMCAGEAASRFGPASTLQVHIGSVNAFLMTLEILKVIVNQSGLEMKTCIKDVCTNVQWCLRWNNNHTGRNPVAYCRRTDFM